MDYKIIEKPAFHAIGKSIRVPMKDDENMRVIPEFWGRSMQDGSREQLIAASANATVFPGMLLGICSDFAPDMSEFTYIIAAENADGSAIDGMIDKPIQANTWAVFESVGALPNAIQSVWQRICAEFFPTAPYKQSEGANLEVYPPGDPRQADYRCEVWIPVERSSA